MEELLEVMKETEVLENMERENKRAGWADQTPAKKNLQSSKPEMDEELPVSQGEGMAALSLV